jgi:hypothetical protein
MFIQPMVQSCKRYLTIRQQTDYLDGFQYVQGALQFFPTAEGYFDYISKQYVFNYTDHLGNVRLSYACADGGGIVLLENNNYYPFGMKHEGYNNYVNGNTNYKYSYNGKEKQYLLVGALLLLPTIKEQVPFRA